MRSSVMERAQSQRLIARSALISQHAERQHELTASAGVCQLHRSVVAGRPGTLAAQPVGSVSRDNRGLVGRTTNSPRMSTDAGLMENSPPSSRTSSPTCCGRMTVTLPRSDCLALQGRHSQQHPGRGSGACRLTDRQHPRAHRHDPLSRCGDEHLIDSCRERIILWEGEKALLAIVERQDDGVAELSIVASAAGDADSVGVSDG